MSELLADLTESYGAILKRLDVGNDIELLWTHTVDDDRVRMRLRHRCDRAARNAGVIICAPEISFEPGRHSVDNAASDVLTISPSILCDDCGLHGYIRAGVWGNA